MPEDERNGVSASDDRQPFHLVDGQLLEQREWREKLRSATELLEAFKRQAYLDHEL